MMRQQFKEIGGADRHIRRTYQTYAVRAIRIYFRIADRSDTIRQHQAVTDDLSSNGVRFDLTICLGEGLEVPEQRSGIRT
jgi:hypothetical protein